MTQHTPTPHCHYEAVDPDATQTHPPWNASEQQVLDNINEQVAAGQTIDAIMDFVFETSQPLFPCDRIGLALVEEDGRRATARWVRALYEPIRLGSGYTQDLHGSSLEGLMKGHQLRIINDVPAYLDTHPRSESTALIMEEGVRASLTCPLTVQGRPVGFLFRSARKPHVYSPREMALHRAMGTRLAQAVDKARRIAELEEATRAYAEMLGFISHELKSPLAGIMTETNLLTEGLLGPINEKQRTHLERIGARGRQLLDLIGAYLDLARVEGPELQARPEPGIDLDKDLIGPVVAAHEVQALEKHIQLLPTIGPPGLKATLDPALMRIVMNNLVSNAIKYGDEGGRVWIKASMEGKDLQLAVRNTGPGFPPEARAALFKRFSRLDQPELKKRKGSGVGLYTCWRIVQLHGGHITAHSKEGQWAEFVVRIPGKG